MKKPGLISLMALAAMAASPALPAVREIEARALPCRPARPLPVKKSRSDIVEAWNAAVDQRKAAKQARKRGGRNA